MVSYLTMKIWPFYGPRYWGIVQNSENLKLSKSTKIVTFFHNLFHEKKLKKYT